MNEAYNIDCMEFMKTFPDKFFDLAVVDPPYGIMKGKNKQQSRLNKYGCVSVANDLKPGRAYFDELFRVTKNQVIWGYNYFSDMLPIAKEFVFWYKHQPVNSYAAGELAWTSFKGSAKVFDYPYFGSVGADSGERIHPMQKPVALYLWIYQNYAKQGDIILDTHLGSGSSRIAAFQNRIDFVGCEINEDFFNKQEERYRSLVNQVIFEEVFG